MIVIACSFVIDTNVLAGSSCRMVSFVFLFVVILNIFSFSLYIYTVFFWNHINTFNLDARQEWMINVQIKNELLRRKRMTVWPHLFLLFEWVCVCEFFCCRLNWWRFIMIQWLTVFIGHLSEQVSLFIEICISCHTHFTFNENDISQNCFVWCICI